MLEESTVNKTQEIAYETQDILCNTSGKSFGSSDIQQYSWGNTGAQKIQDVSWKGVGRSNYCQFQFW